MLKLDEKKNILALIFCAVFFLIAGTTGFAQSTNLLLNGDFSQDTDNWLFWTGDGGSGYLYDNYNQEGVVEVWNAGTQIWSVQMYQQGLTLKKGSTYRCTFKAKAESPRSIQVVLGQTSDPWTPYSGATTINLTSSMEEYTFTFTMDADTDTNAQLEFDFGLNIYDVTIDDITLIETASAQSVKYEVENGILAGGAIVWNHEPCSNGAKVAGLGFGGSSTLTVEAPYSGTFEAEFGYLSEGAHNLEITVNGVLQSTVPFATTGSWFTASTHTIPITLEAGNNTVMLGLSAPVAAPDLDYVTIDFGSQIPALARYSYEAEDGIVAGTAAVGANSRCSGGYKVTGISDTGSLTITANVAEEGFYSAFFKYNSTQDMYFLVEVNGRDIHYVWTNNVAPWNTPETTFTPIYLNQGINTIKIFNNRSETMDLDRLNLVSSEPVVHEQFDFENGISGWTTDGSSATTYALETNMGMNGSQCISIENPVANPGKNYWKRVVQLEPGNYLVRAMVKGENITPQAGGTTGANINIEHTWDRNGDNGLTGTFDWREVYFPMNVKEGGFVNLVFQLGFYFSNCSGKLYFDDIVIMEDFSKVRIDGVNAYVNVDVEDIQLVSHNSLVRWVGHLDDIVTFMRDLVGGAVFDGRKVGVDYSYRYPGGWAIAGEPIIWHKPFMTSELPRIDSMDDWIEGIIHEFGHCTHYGGKEGTWDWNDEIWANFKKALALSELNGQVYAFGRMFVGPEVKELYKSYHGGGGYDNTIAKGIYSGDGLVYILLDLRDTIGLEPFKQTFRDLYANGITGATTNFEKFQKIVDLLNQYSGNPPGYIEGLLGPDWTVLETSGMVD